MIADAALDPHDPTLSHLQLCEHCLSASTTPSLLSSTPSLNRIQSFEITPFVFTGSPASTNVLLMGVADTTVTSVTVSAAASSLGSWFSAPPPANNIVLRDDGFPPDEAAGDGIFSGWLPLRNPPASTTSELVIREVTLTLHRDDSSTETVTEDVGFAVGYLDQLKPLPVHQVESNVWHSLRVVNIVDPSLLSGSYPRIEVETLHASRILYRHFPDAFDWIVNFGLYSARGLASGRYNPVSNQIQGIGRSIFDWTSTYGSSGALRGVIDLLYKGTTPLTHEIFHTWAAPDLASDLGLNTVFGGFAHWGALAHPTRSSVFGRPPTMAGFTDEGEGVFTASEGNGGILPMELYLMGLAPASDIGSYTYVSNVTKWTRIPGSGSPRYEFEGSGVGTFNGSQLIDILGPRSPSYPDVDTFRAAVMVVSEEPLVPAEWDYIERLFEAHTDQFHDDLMGMARISYRLGAAIDGVVVDIPGDAATISVSGPFGIHRVLRSTDLKSWTGLGQFNVTNEIWHFSDTGINGATNKFYRIEWLPPTAP